jgi:quercetin dioxygenase-like cupin family protein
MMVSLFPLLLALQPAAGELSARPLPPPGPIPGQCAEPARENAGKPGCYLAAELRLDDPPGQIRWHLFRFPDEASARAEAARHRWSAVTLAHDQVWLHVLSEEASMTAGRGEAVAVIGPMRLEAGRPVVARFLESMFPPGMTTRPHSHPGAEAFYVIDGVQCMETPNETRLIRAGESWHMPAALMHVQGAPSGRRNMAVVLHREDQAWMSIEREWASTGVCAESG